MIIVSIENDEKSGKMGNYMVNCISNVPKLPIKNGEYYNSQLEEETKKKNLSLSRLIENKFKGIDG